MVVSLVSFAHRFCCGCQTEESATEQTRQAEPKSLKEHHQANEAERTEVLTCTEALEVGGPSLSSGPSALSESGALQSKLKVPFSELTFHVLIGKGSFKQVYRGKWNNTNVAIVAMRRGGLVTEARLMQQLGAHPNLVQFYRWSTDHHGNEYMVVELVPFGSLDKVLAQFGPSLRNRSKLMMCEQICHAMCELASEGVLHRDLAARNILLQSMQPVHVKVSDFGLARVAQHVEDERPEGGGGVPSSGRPAVRGGSSLWRPGEGGGACGREPEQQRTQHPRQQGQGQGQGQAAVEEDAPLVPVRWSAPEVLRPGGGWSEKSDVYSYGVTMWEIFSDGAEPYASRSDQEAAAAILGGDLLPRPKGCPHQVYSLMLDCWHPDPAQRPTFRQIASVYRRWREITIAAKATGGSAHPAMTTGGCGGVTAKANDTRYSDGGTPAGWSLAPAALDVGPDAATAAASSTSQPTLPSGPSAQHHQHQHALQQPQPRPGPTLKLRSGPGPGADPRLQDPGGGYVPVASIWRSPGKVGAASGGTVAREGGVAHPLEAIPSGEVLRLLDHQVHARLVPPAAAPPLQAVGAAADAQAPYPSLVSPLSSPSPAEAATAAGSPGAQTTSRDSEAMAPVHYTLAHGCHPGDGPGTATSTASESALAWDQGSRQPVPGVSWPQMHDGVSAAGSSTAAVAAVGLGSASREALRSLSATGEGICATVALVTDSISGRSNSVSVAAPVAAHALHACPCGAAVSAAAPTTVTAPAGGDGDGESQAVAAAPPIRKDEHHPAVPQAHHEAGRQDAGTPAQVPLSPLCAQRHRRTTDGVPRQQPAAGRPSSQFADNAEALPPTLEASASVLEAMLLMGVCATSTPRSRPDWKRVRSPPVRRPEEDDSRWRPAWSVLGGGGGSKGRTRSGPRRRNTFASAGGGGGGAGGSGGSGLTQTSLSRPSPLRPVLSTASQDVKRVFQRAAAAVATGGPTQDGAAGGETPLTAGTNTSSSWLTNIDEAAVTAAGGFLGLPARYGAFLDPTAAAGSGAGSGAFIRSVTGWEEPSRFLRNALRCGMGGMGSSSGPQGTFVGAAALLNGGSMGVGTGYLCETCVLSLEVETAIDPMMSCSTHQSLQRVLTNPAGARLSPCRVAGATTVASAAGAGGGAAGHVPSTVGGQSLLSTQGLALDVGPDSPGVAAGMAAQNPPTAAHFAGSMAPAEPAAAAAAVASTAVSLLGFGTHPAPPWLDPTAAAAPILGQSSSSPERVLAQFQKLQPQHHQAVWPGQKLGPPAFVPVPELGRSPAVHNPYLSIRMIGP